MTDAKSLSREPTRTMIEAAYPLIEALPRGTPGRDRRAVAEIFRAMWDSAPKPATGGLTRQQLNVQQIIADHIAEHGISPTYDEIAAGMGPTHKRPDAYRVVRALERRGVLERDGRGGNRRNIVLLVQPGEQVKRVQS